VFAACFRELMQKASFSFELANNAIEREIEMQGGAIVLGVDVGRFGDDPSVIYPRCGRDGITVR
jgi:hypothetical protein